MMGGPVLSSRIWPSPIICKRVRHTTHSVMFLMTRNIAQHLATQAPDMWRYLCDFFNKATAQSRVQQLPLVFENAPPYRLGLLMDPRFGHRHHYLSPAIYLGNHQHYKNQQLWLRLDIENLHQYRSDPETLFRIIHNAKPGEAPFVLPAKSRYLANLEATNSIASNNTSSISHNTRASWM